MPPRHQQMCTDRDHKVEFENSKQAANIRTTAAEDNKCLSILASFKVNGISFVSGGTEQFPWFHWPKN